MTLDEYIHALEAIRAEHGGALKVCHVSMQPDCDGESKCTPVKAPCLLDTQAEQDDGTIEHGVVVALAPTEADAWEARWAALRVEVDDSRRDAHAAYLRHGSSYLRGERDALTTVQERMDEAAKAGEGGGP